MDTKTFGTVAEAECWRAGPKPDPPQKQCNCEYEALRLKTLLLHERLGVPSYVNVISVVGIFFMMALVIIPFKTCKQVVYAKAQDDEDSGTEIEMETKPLKTEEGSIREAKFMAQ